jgi:hypothetical protein
LSTIIENHNTDRKPTNPITKIRSDSRKPKHGNISKQRKSLTIAKHNIKCKIKLRDTMMEQVPNSNYLVVEISAKRDLQQGVRVQSMKAARISGSS